MLQRALLPLCVENSRICVQQYSLQSSLALSRNPGRHAAATPYQHGTGSSVTPSQKTMWVRH